MTNRNVSGLLMGALLLVTGAGALQAQHQVDMWVGETAQGQLALGGIDRSTPITLSPTSGLLTGWAGVDPGFDGVVDPATNQGLQPLRAGSEIWMHVTSMSPGLRLIDQHLHAHDPTSAVHDHLLGDEHLHVHFTWHIDSSSAAFDPIQTAWQIKFTLHDTSGSIQASDELTLTFRNVEARAGEIDGDGSLSEGDIHSFYAVLAAPALAEHRERAAADVDLDGFVTPADECPFLAVHGRGGFTRGDANGDAGVDMADSVFTLAFLFLGGEAPRSMTAADANGDSSVEISDPIYLLQYLFTGGSAPPAPFPGTDCAQP